MRQFGSGAVRQLGSGAMGFCFLLIAGCAVLPVSAGQAGAADPVWTFVTEVPGRAARTDLPPQAAIVRLDRAAYESAVRNAPASPSAATSDVIVAFPLPNRTLVRFRVAESSMLAPELAKAYPLIRTFIGQGVDDRSATARFGWTDKGFHALLLMQGGDVYIDAYAPGETQHYITMKKAQ